MSKKLLRCLYLTSIVLANVPFALAEEQRHSCPDMTQHERVLNEGLKMQTSRSNSWPSWGLMMIPPERATDYTPSQREADVRSSIDWLEGRIATLPLTTRAQRQAAEEYSRQLEELGMYKSARKLYERLYEIRKTNPSADQIELSKLAKDMERAKLCLTAQDLLPNSKCYPIVVDSLSDAVENISTSDMNVLAKSLILDRIMADIKKAVAWQGLCPGLPQETLLKAESLKSRAEEVSKNWKRELECLGMAQKLDSTAFNLELQGEYALSEKLYRQSLEIKLKNLGANNPETLAQNADFARLRWKTGNSREARKYFEDALAALRKHPHPGKTYMTMLEGYGDLLDQMNDKSGAEKIYAEARAYHRKHDAASP